MPHFKVISEYFDKAVFVFNAEDAEDARLQASSKVFEDYVGIDDEWEPEELEIELICDDELFVIEERDL